MAEAKNGSQTPLIDQLEEGPWPSFVTEMKLAAEVTESPTDLMRQLEQSYVDRIVHWKHGGIVGVKGYGAGIVGRYSDMPEEFPGVAAFHTVRVNQPAGWFYTSEILHKLCDIWDKYGSGLTNMHGATGDILLLGTTTENLQPCFDELAEIGFDLGGSGSGLRTPSCCVGQARCEWSAVDVMAMTHELTNVFQDELHRPMFPYKFKVKIAGCTNDCVASIARSDMAIMGTWRDNIRINTEAVREYADSGMDMESEIVGLCPGKAISWNSEKRTLSINNRECKRCMNCINRMPKALRPGKEKGVTILVGGKAPIVHGALLAWVIVPFMSEEEMANEDGPFGGLIDFVGEVIDWWDERAKMRERIGELILRVGMRHFLRDLGLKPLPQMIFRPRANPYMFWWPEEVQ